MFFIITALLIQYLWLEGPVIAAKAKGYSQYAFPAMSSSWNLKEYRLVNYSVRLEVPENTELIVTPDQGQEMQFNIYFSNEPLAFRGYLQLWQIGDLESFLKDSKALSPFDFIYYELSGIGQNLKDGFKAEWTADFGESWISGCEYWLRLENTTVVRLSFFTDTKDFPEGLSPVIQKMIDSLVVTEAP